MRSLLTLIVISSLLWPDCAPALHTHIFVACDFPWTEFELGGTDKTVSFTLETMTAWPRIPGPRTIPYREFKDGTMEWEGQNTRGDERQFALNIDSNK
jgi:hypothetical protein